MKNRRNYENERLTMSKGKYRAWHNDLKVMLYDTVGDDDLFTKIGCRSSHEIKITHDCVLHENEPCESYYGGGYWGVLFDKECVYMQNTGLRDRNGNDGYEGDIVKLEGNGWNGDIWILSLKPYGPSLYYEKDGERYGYHRGDFYYGYDFDFEEAEIIGNVHQNPELLRTGG